MKLISDLMSQFFVLLAHSVLNSYLHCIESVCWNIFNSKAVKS